MGVREGVGGGGGVGEGAGAAAGPAGGAAPAQHPLPDEPPLLDESVSNVRGSPVEVEGAGSSFSEWEKTDLYDRRRLATFPLVVVDVSLHTWSFVVSFILF